MGRTPPRPILDLFAGPGGWDEPARARLRGARHRPRSSCLRDGEGLGRGGWLGGETAIARAADSIPAAAPGEDCPASELLAEHAEAAAVDRGDAVGRSALFPWPFRRRFRYPFRRPFPIRRCKRGAIRHRCTNCGNSILPTSLRPIEVWS
jgi:hypothetical protein